MLRCDWGEELVVCKDGNNTSEVLFGYNLDKFGKEPHEWPWIDYYVSMIWWAAFYLSLGPRRDINSPIPRWRQVVIPLLAGTAASLPLILVINLLLLLVGAWPLFLSSKWRQLLQLTTTPGSFCCLFIATLLGAAILFWIRKKFQLFYGAAEVVFGVMVIGFGYFEASKVLLADQELDPFKVFAAIIGGVYVILHFPRNNLASDRRANHSIGQRGGVLE